MLGIVFVQVSKIYLIFLSIHLINYLILYLNLYVANEIDEETNKLAQDNSKGNFDFINNNKIVENDKINDEEYLRLKKELLASQLIDNITKSDNINNDEIDIDDTIDGLSEDIAINKAIANASVCPAWEGATDVIPTTSLLLQFDQVMTQKILGYHVEWLTTRQLSSSRGKWLYSLLAKLEKPLHQDISALMRQLYRRCSILRYDLTNNNNNNNKLTFDDQLAVLNLLISITGSYFGQGEEYFDRVRDEINDNDDSDENNMNDEDNNDVDDDDESDDEDDYDFGDEGWEEVIVENMDYEDNNNNNNSLEEGEICNNVLDIL